MTSSFITEFEEYNYVFHRVMDKTSWNKIINYINKKIDYNNEFNASYQKHKGILTFI